MHIQYVLLVLAAVVQFAEWFKYTNTFRLYVVFVLCECSEFLGSLVSADRWCWLNPHPCHGTMDALVGLTTRRNHTRMTMQAYVYAEYV